MKLKKIDGIEYCKTHDDFAREGYDWYDHDVCETAWHQHQTRQPQPCDLFPMFIDTMEGMTP